MASQNNPNTTYNVEQVADQAQMRRNEYVNQPSEIHNQGQATNFLQETGTQVKNIAQSAVNIAQGAATGAANMTYGAADAVKNALGIKAPVNTTTTTNTIGGVGGTTVNHPASNVDMGGSTYPSNPSTRM